MFLNYSLASEGENLRPKVNQLMFKLKDDVAHEKDLVSRQRRIFSRSKLSGKRENLK